MKFSLYHQVIRTKYSYINCKTILRKNKMSRFNHVFIVFVVTMAMMVFNGQTDILAATGSVNARETYQTMEGFGASIAWWYGELFNHPNKEDIYYYIFDELGLDILRLRNIYGKSTRFDIFAEIVDRMYSYSDNSPKIMISSWTPPANLKSNNSVNGGNSATLKKDATTGKYMYGEFAKYWVDALGAYKLTGIEPDFISIQNEPSYDASWESCFFSPTENTATAGYDRALDSVYYALQQESLSLRIVGPEVHGIGYNTFQNYARRYNHDYLDVYAYHLYHGGDGNINPDSFNSNLSAIANTYSEKPIFQTEYDYGGWFNTAWLMHNCLVYGNVSGYLYWALVGTWEITAALIRMENPTNPGSWTTDDGYLVSQTYWAFRQYSKFISSGWKRVMAEVDADGLRMSAYISPEGDMLTLVILNVGQEDEDLSFNIQGFSIDNGEIIRTSETEQGEEISSNYDGSSNLAIPARSITTVQFMGKLTNVVEMALLNPTEFSLVQNYPNPFNPSTTIEFDLPKTSHVTLKIFNIIGEEVATLVSDRLSAGSYSYEWSRPAGIASGVYLYRLEAEEFIETKKMILLR